MLIELHELLLVGVGGVAHSERDSTVFDAANARVGDRDVMGVGAEVAEHTLRTGERRFCVDNSVATAKRSA